MSYRRERWEETGDALLRYPEPDYSTSGTVAVVGLSGEEPVGYLVVQDDRLAWWPKVGPEVGWAYGVRLLVEENIQVALAARWGAGEAWRSITSKVPILSIDADVDLMQLAAQVWGPTTGVNDLPIDHQ